jgi:hypothetical protein
MTRTPKVPIQYLPFYVLFLMIHIVLAFVVILSTVEYGVLTYVSILSGKTTSKGVFRAPPGVPLTGCLTNSPHVEHILESWMTTLIVASFFFTLTFLNFLSLVRRKRGHWNIPRVTDVKSLTPLFAAFYRDGTLFFFLIFAVVLVSTVATVTMQGPLAGVSIPWIITVYTISASRLVLNLRVAAYKQNPHSTWAQTMTVQEI